MQAYPESLVSGRGPGDAGGRRGQTGSLLALMDALVAPPVVAVIVTSNPGEWFEETLAAFASQDYPELSVLVLDAASTIDPTPMVAAVLPNAYVRRLPAESRLRRQCQ